MISRTNRCATVAGMAFSLFSSILAGRASADGPLPGRSDVPSRVLILTGGGDHDWRSTAPIIRRLLDETGRFDVRVCESPVGLTGSTLADFDLLIDDYAGPSLGIETERAIANFVESGKGLIVTQG